MKRGLFMTVEGGEGVGKTTFVAALVAALQRDYPQQALVVTREPGGTTLAERMRDIFKAPPADEELTPEGEFFLISAARAQHVAYKIRPALEQGAWVVCDRFADSSVVYQGVARSLDLGLIEAVNAKATGQLRPDMTFVLDCPEDVARRRVGERSVQGAGSGGVPRYDEGDAVLYGTLRQGFLQLAQREPQRFVVLDSRKPPAELVGEALDRIAAIGGKRG